MSSRQSKPGKIPVFDLKEERKGKQFLARVMDKFWKSGFGKIGIPWSLAVMLDKI